MRDGKKKSLDLARDEKEKSWDLMRDRKKSWDL
jgi:hypothetical protein